MADFTYLVDDIKNTAEDDSAEFLSAISKNEWKNTPIIIVGNKVDLGFEKGVKKQSQNLVEKKLKRDLVFTSAKTGENMNETFDLISKIMVGGRENGF